MAGVPGGPAPGAGVPEAPVPATGVPPARVVVVGLGPAGDDLLPAASVAAMVAARACFLRTARHPSAAAAAAAVTAAGGQVTALDDVYEAAADFDAVYEAIAERVAGAARAHGGDPGATVCLAVPGSPLVAERTVDLLRARPDLTVEVVPALSFLDLAWARLGVDPLAAGVRIVDAAAFAVDAAGQAGPFLVGQCHDRHLLSEVKLAVDEAHELAGAAPPDAVVLHHLGLPDEAVRRVPWAELDRGPEPDHLTALWVPASVALSSEAARLQELVRVLRQRCPWDRRQTHGSLAPHLVEETYEAVDAIEAVDAARRAGHEPSPEAVEHLLEELGDVAFQVFFHARLATESGWFTVADVLRGVHDKLVHRHPHVFGDAVAETAEDVAGRWEQLKQQEKGRASVFDGIPGALPALATAAKVQRKAEGLGITPNPGAPRATALVAALAITALEDDAPPEAAAAAGEAGTAGARRATDGGSGGAAVGAAGDDRERLVGDALFAVVDLARRAGVDPETALRAVTAEFRRRAERGR